MKPKYSVFQTFETFGDPCQKTFSSITEAQEYADELANLIATGFYARIGDDAEIPYYSKYGKTGNSADIEFFDSLSDEAGADCSDNNNETPGRLPWNLLVSKIRNRVIEIQG